METCNLNTLIIIYNNYYININLLYFRMQFKKYLIKGIKQL